MSLFKEYYLHVKIQIINDFELESNKLLFYCYIATNVKLIQDSISRF